jgi:dipeptidyl-peptidase-4
MNRNLLSALCLLIVLVSPIFFAQQPTNSPVLTLERIFSSSEFEPEKFGPPRWLDSDREYTVLQPSATSKEKREIVRYDAENGQRSILVSATQLIPPGQPEPLVIDDYAWSKDRQQVLIFTNSQRLWRQNTRGDYWVLDLANGKLSKLGGDARPSTLMFAQFSPDGKRVAYVRENNLYVENLGNHQILQVTKDGSRTIINGTFDWVYEEEFFLRNGFRWSPDSQFIAYWQLDSQGVPEFYLINNTDSLYPKVTPVVYPKAGQLNSAARIGVIRADGGATRWLDVPGDPRNHYIASLEWVANSDELMLQQLNRLQNTNQVMLADIRTGQVRNILTEKDETWVDLRTDDIHWLEDGKFFTWVSERDGWRHVYVVSRDGRSVILATPGQFDVIGVEGIDEKGGWLYYAASPENATQRYLYRVRLDDHGQAERLTPEGQPGTHTYEISPHAGWAFHTYSTFDTPPQTDLVRLPDHHVLRQLSANAEVRAKVAELNRGPSEFFRVPVDGNVSLDGWIMKPPSFDPSKRYPVLFYVYGEPWSQTVLDGWGGVRHLWHLLLTQQGYLVASVDNQGTPAPRGRAWRKIIYRQVGVLASQQQAGAARKIGQWAFVDSTRIGIWGWSGGGSMSLNAIFRYPDIYRTAMAVAPVSDMHYYDTIYQERYMGLPQEHEEDYKGGSPITFAEQLKGNLLIVHGTGDDNVHYQGTEALINKLVAANKPFSMMSYPNRTHTINEGQSTERHLFELLTRYLHENLPSEPAAH